MRRRTTLGLGLLAAVLVAGCGDHGGPGGAAGHRLNAGGSSFIYPMMSRWCSDYAKLTGVEVNYQSIGSGGGIQQMTVKTFDFGCTDGPMNEEQQKKAHEIGGDVIHVPLVMGAVVPAYNLAGLTEPLTFTGPLLADIFLGNVKKWNDPGVRELNPKADLPDQDIVVVHRSDGSGTTYIWADYLSKVSPAWKEKVGVGTSVNWPVGVGQKGNEGVAGQVKRSAGSIGYVELNYALRNNIPYGSVRNRDGATMKATLESVTAAANASLASIPDDLRYSITNAPGKDSYPISGTTWAVLYVDQPPGKGQTVVDFLRWTLREGQEMAKALDYARLPPGLVERALKKLDTVRVGKAAGAAG